MVSWCDKKTHICYNNYSFMVGRKVIINKIRGILGGWYLVEGCSSGGAW